MGSSKRKEGSVRKGDIIETLDASYFQVADGRRNKNGQFTAVKIDKTTGDFESEPQLIAMDEVVRVMGKKELQEALEVDRREREAIEDAERESAGNEASDEAAADAAAGEAESNEVSVPNHPDNGPTSAPSPKRAVNRSSQPKGKKGGQSAGSGQKPSAQTDSVPEFGVQENGSVVFPINETAADLISLTSGHFPTANLLRKRKAGKGVQCTFHVTRGDALAVAQALDQRAKSPGEFNLGRAPSQSCGRARDSLLKLLGVSSIEKAFEETVAAV